MKVKELKEILNSYDDDLDISINRNGSIHTDLTDVYLKSLWVNMKEETRLVLNSNINI